MPTREVEVCNEAETCGEAVGTRVQPRDEHRVKYGCFTPPGLSQTVPRRAVHFVELGDDGYPIQNRSITDYPGLYFVGLPRLHNAKSGLLFGLAQHAEHIAAAIDEGSYATLDGIGTRTYYIPPAEVRSREVSNELSTSRS